MKTATERFLSYVRFDTTTSSLGAKDPPSMDSLFALVAREAKELGMSVYQSTSGILYAHLKATKDAPSLGFIVHADTSDECKGAGIVPCRHTNYDGKLLKLSNGITLSPKDYPFLSAMKGEAIITSSGTTLLGADDKAGLAEALAGIEEAIASHTPHGDIYLVLTRHEESGRGTEGFETGRYPPDFSYTLDGAALAEISSENFNAATVKVSIRGVGIHPGEGKDKMINALLVWKSFDDALPAHLTPRDSAGRDGYIHLMSLNGRTSSAEAEYLIREFDEVAFKDSEDAFRKAAKIVNDSWSEELITLSIEESYYNMAPLITREMLTLPEEALQPLGVTPIHVPVRDGTDGALLSHMGRPTPNLGTGGYNFHSPRELICERDLELGSKRVEAMIRILGNKKR